MSYSFDGVDDVLTGTFTSTYADPLTLACFFKLASFPVAQSFMVNFGNSSSTTNQSYAILNSNIANEFAAWARDTVAQLARVGGFAGYGSWSGLVGTFTSDTLRDGYLTQLSTTGSSVVATAITDTLQFIAVGRSLLSSSPYPGKLAEIAIWNSVLGASDIDTYMHQTRRASAIQTATLIGYWPLDVDATLHPNKGSDIGGALVPANGAVYDSDHPPLNPTATYKLMGQINS